MIKMEITLISPYHGGSHQAWANGLKSNSRHQVHLLTLPARFWKWRMHGAAVTLARRFLEQGHKPDVLLATDMLDLSTFLALTRRKTHNIPAVLYMHENQLTYPLPMDKTTGPMRRQQGERDHHYAFINYASMMAADRVLFNSSYHYHAFFSALPKFLKHFPEYNELGSIKQLESRSEILPVGIDLKRLENGVDKNQAGDGRDDAPIILWNQRWEYDKNPEDFFAALRELAGEGIPFRLILCGRRYGKNPPAFDQIIQQFSERIIHVGHAPLPQYKKLLWQADIVVSTAFHEFFGISMIEAIFAQTFPILPNRLSYPELIPEKWQRTVFYDNQNKLVERLRWAINHPQIRKKVAQKLAHQVTRYDWGVIASLYDDRLESGLI